jgi:hypothetical protein
MTDKNKQISKDDGQQLPTVIVGKDHCLTKLLSSAGVVNLAEITSTVITPVAGLLIARGCSEEDAIAKAAALIAIANPTNELELMLASQMAVTSLLVSHTAAQAYNAKTHNVLNAVSNQTVKFNRIYLEQINALQRLQGKSRTQKIVVEKVNIEAGGQAAIGVYEGGANYKK